MKKIALAAMAAIVATVSLSSLAAAGSRDGEEWRREGRHHDRGFNDGRRHENARHHDDTRRDNRWRRHNGWRNDGWRHDGWRQHGWREGYWGAPRVVIAPEYNDYCFVKKVRRYDDWGNVYIKRVRVCR